MPIMLDQSDNDTPQNKGSIVYITEKKFDISETHVGGPINTAIMAMAFQLEENKKPEYTRADVFCFRKLISLSFDRHNLRV